MARFGGDKTYTIPRGEYKQEQRPLYPTVGEWWLKESTEEIFYFDGSDWVVNLITGQTGIFAGGNTVYGTTDINTIDYITISSTGDATDFGDLTVTRHNFASCSNGNNNRGVFAGGFDYPITFYNIIDYITMTTTGDATDFGDFSFGKRIGNAGCSNGTNDRGIFNGGFDSTALLIINTIDYITISTTSDSIDFGDMTIKRNLVADVSNGTNERGVFAGGDDGTSTVFNTIDYITISSTGNATDFGDLTNRYSLGGCSNDINDRGIFAGGYDAGGLNIIEYITISSTGNASDFGDLTFAQYSLRATSNGTNGRGVFAGGVESASRLNIIEYITISSLGNANDFGDLTVARSTGGATSNSAQ